ncbi:DNA-binding response regulator [bacterium 1xD8-6]|nr:DNA-binding response regulator [bacterium D16-36]RKI72999.1 DNA-binding response regulator [bacterium 1xD8-6]
MKKVLVVEDDWDLNQGICHALSAEGYETISSHSRKKAEGLFLQNEVDMILLDVNLPDGDGFSFCRWVKGQRSIPVLFLTARDLEEDALEGYEAGADDYITKPFSIRVLLKKMDVMFRREKDDRPKVFEDGYLMVDFDRAKVQIQGEDCLLTPTEFRLLRQMIEHKGQLLTYSVLLECVWENDGQFVDKHTLAVNVNRLRGKIEDGEHKYISNVYGMGYQWLS